MKTISITSITVSHSTGVLTGTTNPEDGDTVTIGSVVYRFKDSLTATNDVKRHASDMDTSMGNLIKAINASGTPETDYKGITSPSSVIASGTLISHAFTVTAVEAGIGGDLIATTTTSTHIAWGAALMSGGATVSISGTVSDVTYGIMSQIQTVEDPSVTNANWSRALRMTTQACQVIRFGGAGAAIDASSIAKIGMALEPTLTWPLVIATQPASKTVASGATTFLVAITANELTTTYQWQVDTGTGFVNITNAGVYTAATTDTLHISSVSGLGGCIYRCVLTNAAGNVTSGAATLTVA